MGLVIGKYPSILAVPKIKKQHKFTMPGLIMKIKQLSMKDNLESLQMVSLIRWLIYEIFVGSSLLLFAFFVIFINYFNS